MRLHLGEEPHAGGQTKMWGKRGWRGQEQHLGVAVKLIGQSDTDWSKAKLMGRQQYLRLR